MANLSSQSLVNLAVWMTVVGVLVGVAAFFVKNVRENSLHRTDDILDANRQLTEFREMNARGELSDEEFRSIKTKLRTQLMDDLNDSKEGS